MLNTYFDQFSPHPYDLPANSANQRKSSRKMQWRLSKLLSIKWKSNSILILIRAIGVIRGQLLIQNGSMQRGKHSYSPQRHEETRGFESIRSRIRLKAKRGGVRRDVPGRAACPLTHIEAWIFHPGTRERTRIVRPLSIARGCQLSAGTVLGSGISRRSAQATGWLIWVRKVLLAK